MTQIEEDTRSLTIVVMHTLFSGLMTLLALAGNLLVFLALYRNRRLRSITNLYVLSLAVADVTVATFFFPFKAIASGLRKWPFGYNFTQFVGCIQLLWILVSVCTLTLTAVNRYFCVVKPQRYSIFFSRKKATVSIILVWLIMCVISFTVAFSSQFDYLWNPNVPIFRIETARAGNIACSCFGLLSISIVVYGYGSVYRVILRHNNAVAPSLQRANSSGAVRAQEIKSCRVLFATVFGFCTTWFPWIPLIILEHGFNISIPSVALSIAMLSTSISTWINPVIYGVMNRAMRKEFQNILLCRN